MNFDKILKREKKLHAIPWDEQLRLLKVAADRATDNNPLSPKHFVSIVYKVWISRLNSSDELLTSFSVMDGNYKDVPADYIKKWANQYINTHRYLFGPFKKSGNIETFEDYINAVKENCDFVKLARDVEITAGDVLSFIFSKHFNPWWRLAFIAGIPLALYGLYSFVFKGERTTENILMALVGALLGYSIYSHAAKSLESDPNLALDIKERRTSSDSGTTPSLFQIKPSEAIDQAFSTIEDFHDLLRRPYIPPKPSPGLKNTELFTPIFETTLFMPWSSESKVSINSPSFMTTSESKKQEYE